MSRKFFQLGLGIQSKLTDREYEVVPKFVFDGGFSPGIHKYGHFPKWLTIAFVKAIPMLEDLEKWGDFILWRKMKLGDQDVLRFGFVFDEWIELDAELSLTGFVAEFTPVPIASGFLMENERIGVFVIGKDDLDHELVVVEGPITPQSHDPRQFSNLTCKAKIARVLASKLNGIEAERARSHGDIFRQSNAITHSPSIEDLVDGEVVDAGFGQRVITRFSPTSNPAGMGVVDLDYTNIKGR